MKTLINIDVRFSETDQMGIVYHGNYFSWFDMGRMDFLKKLGLDYRYFEDRGLMLPVLDVECKYISPLSYGDSFKLVTSLERLEGIRLYFKYEIYLEDKLMSIGKTKHVFVDRDMRPVSLRKIDPRAWEILLSSYKNKTGN